MLRSFLRQSLVVLAGCAASLVCISVFAQATITLSDSNCSDFSLGGTPGNRTLTCVVNTPPSCTVTGSHSGTINSQLTLTASCSPAATSYVWSGGAIGSCSTVSCNDPGTGYANNQVVNYTVTGTNGAGGGPTSAQFAVTWTNTPPAVPSNCSISGVPGNASAGTQVSATINCTSGGTANAWTWTSGATGQSTQTTTAVTVNTTTTFTAKASADGGTTWSSAASATVTVGGGGGGGWQGSCPGYATTYVYGSTWTGGVGWTLNDVSGEGPFGTNDIIVIRVNPPANAQATSSGSLSAIEWNGPPAGRYGALSTIPCDLTGAGLIVKSDGVPPLFTAVNNAPPTIATWVGANQPKHTVLLQGGVEYYYNITNQTPAGGTTCVPGPNCDMLFTFKKPGGT